MELDPYLGILVMVVLTAGFLVTMLILSSILGPKNPTRTKQLPFECGSVSVGDVRQSRFNVRFYVVAMSFILFDIEVIFLYPWAVNLHVLGWSGFYAMLFFIVVLALGLLYEWKKGLLDWANKPKHEVP
ncbi:MAG: NADH-quinone oxidoreductase subunit A [Bdellovibrionales bacterium]|nr:NADH-quinone oxidoreductase subunit A [Bdellovibrionales bacterium]